MMELLALRLMTYWRVVRMYMRRHARACVSIIILSAFLIVAIRFWHFWATAIPAKLSAVAKAILVFVEAHPGLSTMFHVFVNMVPDIAYLLLAIAGLSYLVPKFVEKVEKSTPLRAAVITVFACFALLAIIVNSINREEQDRKDSALSGKLDKQGGKMEIVSTSIHQVLLFLAQSKGQTPNEAERRRQVLEALRSQYVIDHPNVPVTMITGNLWPPKEWMSQRLRELGEKWPYIPANEQTIAAAAPPPPPAIDLTVVVSEKNEDLTHATYAYKPGMNYIEEERACSPNLKCHPERDFASGPTDIKIGDKGWARVFFLVYNVGGSTVPHPTVDINVGSGRDVFVDRANQRQSREHGITLVEFSPKETVDLIPFSKSQQNYEYAIDVSVGPLSENFALVFRIFGENLKSHLVVVPFHVVRI